MSLLGEDDFRLQCEKGIDDDVCRDVLFGVNQWDMMRLLLRAMRWMRGEP